MPAGRPGRVTAIREQERDDAVGERRDQLAVRELAEHGRLVLRDVRGEGGEVGRMGLDAGLGMDRAT